MVIALASCSKESVNELSNKPNVVEPNNSLGLQNGVIKFNSLESFLETTKKAKELGEENYYNINIKPLLINGYKPLRPYFSDDESFKDYIRQKYPDTLDVDEIELDDSVIIDPAFQVLLNDNRQVIVANKLYTYKSNGVYITDLSKDIIKTTARITSDLSTLDASTIFIEMDYSSETSHDYSQKNNIENTSQTNSVSKLSSVNEELDFNTTTNFSYDKAGSGGLLGPALGFTKTIYVYTPNSRRVKIKYWDRNWYLFQSKGVEVRFQKKKRILWTTVWQKSYPTKVALGFNHITYEAKSYRENFDWNAFLGNNNPFSNLNYNNNDLYVYKNAIYNRNNSLVIARPNISFPIKSILNADDFPVKIYRMNNNKYLIDESVSSLFNDGFNDLLNNKLTDVKNIVSELRNSNTSPPIKFFDFNQNKVTYSLANIKTIDKGDNSIKKYIDFGILVSLKWGSDKFEFDTFTYSAKPIDLVEVKSFDMYGAALYNGVWYGKRIVGYSK